MSRMEKGNWLDAYMLSILVHQEQKYFVNLFLILKDSCSGGRIDPRLVMDCE